MMRIVAWVISATLVAGAGEAIAQMEPQQQFGDSSIVVEPAAGKARAGEAFPITYTVTWSGAAEEFNVQAPDLPSVDWGRLELATAKAFQQDGKNAIAFTIEATAHQDGEFEIPEILIGLHPEELQPPGPAGAPAPPADPDVYPKLRAEPLTLRVYPKRTPVWIPGALLGAFCFLLPIGAVWLYYRRRRAVQTAESSVGAAASPPQAARRFLLQARRHRLTGDYHAYYRALSEAAAQCGTGGEESARGLRARAEAVGYGSHQPTPDELDGDLREVERLVEGNSASVFENAAPSGAQ